MLNKKLLLFLFIALPLQAQTPQAAPPITVGQPVGDPGLWNYTLAIRTDVVMSDTKNEYGASFLCNSNPSQATSPYEKICFIPWITQTDASDYSKGLFKDAVSIDARCYIDGGIKTGRCWAGYFEAGVQAGSDGMTVAIELAGDNKGPDQPLRGQPNSKGLLGLVAGENGATAPITNFISLVGGSQSAHMGIIAEDHAFVDPINSIVFGIQSNTNGLYNAEILADGSILGRHIIPLYNTPGLNPGLLPAMRAGEIFYWGDTSTGQSYFTYYDGSGYAVIPTDTPHYIKGK